MILTTSGNTIERTTWLKILALVLASRFLLFFIGLFTLYVHGREAHFDWSTWIEMTCRWDCGWYGEIINGGYSKGVSLQNSVTNWAFYPLLPLLVGLVQSLLGISDFRVAGMLLSTTAFILALGLIYRYARLLGNSERVAMTSVLIVAFLPQSIVFSATYTESLFLCLLAGAMVAMRQKQYVLAGICAALLSATRSNGIFIIVFIAVHLFLQLGPQTFFRPWRQPLAFLPLLMAPLGAFMFWTYAFHVTGDAFAMATTVQHGWGWSWEVPLSNVPNAWKLSTDARFWVLGSLFTAVCCLLLLRYRWYAEFALCCIIFIMIWGGVVPNSLWRYSMVLFPAWIALARLLEGREALRMGLFAALGLIGGFLMHAWALQLNIAI